MFLLSYCPSAEMRELQVCSLPIPSVKKKKKKKIQFHIKPTCASEWKKDKYSTYYTHFKKGEKMLVATTCPILI